MYQALEVASSETAAPAAASALYIYYVVIGGRFAPPYKYMVKYRTKIEQKQQREQHFHSLLPPELETLTLHEGGLPNIKGGLPLFRPLEYLVMWILQSCLCTIRRTAISLASLAASASYSKGLKKGSPPLMFGSPPSWSVYVSSSGGSKL